MPRARVRALGTSGVRPILFRLTLSAYSKTLLSYTDGTRVRTYGQSQST